MPEQTHSFGYWLRRRRKALDLTQEALARMVACSRFAIRKIEADERRPSRRLAERLADKLAVPAAERDAFLAVARAARVDALVLDGAPVVADGAGPDDAVETSARTAPRADAGTDVAPFVGRGDEMARLGALLGQLGSANGFAVLVEGEPGIGKTRLLEELATRCAASGVAMIATKCYEIERAMAYQPVIDLASKLLEHEGGRAETALAPAAMAEIASLVPALASRADARAASSDLPDARQARVFQAMLALAQAAAAPRPIVLAVDDAQWADEASLRFIHYAGRMAAGRAMMLVCAYRDEELAMHEDLAAVVESLRRERHAHHVRLARLGQRETEALVANLAAGGTDAAALATRLQRETQGNPFFILSIVQALAHGEAPADDTTQLPLPDALRASVRARLAHLPQDARAILDVAALLGRRFDAATIVAATRRPEDEVAEALEGLVRRRLLREDADDGFHDFAHDKVREVVYREIGASRRIALHRAVAEVLESGDAGEAREREGWLAEHYERARVWDKAVRYLALAAERSRKAFAMRDALHWLDRALALVHAHPEAIEGGLRTQLHAQRGAARALAGQTEGAVADMRRVIEDAQARGDRRLVRDGFIQLGMAYRRADHYAHATDCLTRALAESRIMNDERQAADTLYHLGTVMWSEGRSREATAYHAEAVAICERLGLDDLVAVQAYHGRGESHYDSLEPAAAIACYERSIELARRIGDKAYECENLMMIGFACTGYMGLADYARAEASYKASLDIARKADLQWHLGPTLLGLDHLRACAGQYGEAWRGMSKTLAWLESVKQTRYQIIAHDLLALLLLEASLDREALEQCERGIAVAEHAGISFWRPRIEAYRAIARLRLGEPGAMSALERAYEETSAKGTAHQAVRCLEGLAEAALAAGNAHRALDFAERMLRIAQPGGLREIEAAARRWRGEALLGLAEHDEAQRELASALREATALGRPRLAADVHRALARLYEAGRHEREAAGHRAEESRLRGQIAQSLEGCQIEA